MITVQAQIACFAAGHDGRRIRRTSGMIRKLLIIKRGRNVFGGGGGGCKHKGLTFSLPK